MRCRRSQVLLTVLVCLWALRLGSFLVLRISRAGSDSRFDKVRDKPLGFLLFWMIQVRSFGPPPFPHTFPFPPMPPRALSPLKAHTDAAHSSAHN